MKSSSSESPSTPLRTATWAPRDIGGQRVSRPGISEKVLSIFTPPSGSAARAPSLHDAKALIRVTDQAQALCQSWMPGEVEACVRVCSETAQGVAMFPSVSVRQSKPVDPAPAILAEVHRKADGILLEAQKTAGEIVQRAQVQSEQAIADGYARGRDDARAEAASSLQSAQAMIAELAVWREQMISQSEETVIEMIRQIARLMFGSGIRMDKDALQTYLNEVVENTRSLGDLNIFLNPDDSTRLEPTWAEHQAQIRGSRVRIAGSAGILPGGCLIKGQMGSVDATVETKLAAVIETLSPQPDTGGQD